MTYEERKQQYIIRATAQIDTPEIRAEAEARFDSENTIKGTEMVKDSLQRVKATAYAKTMMYQAKRHKEDGLLLRSFSDAVEEIFRENELLKAELERLKNDK